MKKTLLLFAFIFVTSLTYAQCGGGGIAICGVGNSSYSHTPPSQPDFKVQLYPNPAINYIKVTDEARLKTIRIYTLSGTMLKEFKVVKDESYDVSDLADGNYLIRFFDWKDKPLKAKLFQKFTTKGQR